MVGKQKRKLGWALGTMMLVITLIILPIIGAEDSHTTLNLAQLKKKVMANNLEIERAKEMLTIAKYKQKQIEDGKVSTSGSAVELAKNNGYNLQEAKMYVANAQWQLEQIRQKVWLEAYQAYFDHQFSLEDIQVANTKLDTKRKELEQVKVKLELGMAVQSEQDNIQHEIDQAKYQLQILGHKREKILLNLNRVMNEDLATGLVFESETVPLKEYASKEKKADIEKALKNNGDLERLREEERLQSQLLQLYKNIGASEKTITNVKEVLSKKNLDVKDKEVAVAYGVWEQYSRLLNGYDTLRIKELEVENAQLNSQIVSSQLEVGLKTKQDFQQTKDAVATAEIAYKQAKLAYHIMVEEYKNLLN